jgi:hypothetical protein
MELKESSSDAVAAQQAYNDLDMLYALLIKIREKTPARFRSREMEDARIAIREAQAFIRDELAGKI